MPAELSSCSVEAILSGVQVILAVVVIALILMHSGKDSGLSGAFGVGTGAGPFGGGSLVERNLNRWTIAFSLLFVVNVIVLLKIVRRGGSAGGAGDARRGGPQAGGGDAVREATAVERCLARELLAGRELGGARQDREQGVGQAQVAARARDAAVLDEEGAAAGDRG